MIIFFRLLFFVGIVSSAYAYFEEYNARNAYMQGEHARAQKLYDELLTRQPDDASAAYNCGKIALKEKEFEKAEAYFNHVTQNVQVPQTLREQAWYDAGLSFVHRELWHDALKSFEEALKINPDNDYAKKMIEQIQKKLDEQKQQQEQQDEQSSDSDEKKDDKNDSEKNNQNDSQSDNNENNDQDQKNSDDQKQDDQSQNADKEEQNKDRNEQSQENAEHNNNEQGNGQQNAPQQQNKQEEQQQQSNQSQPQQPEKQESALNDQQDKKAPVPQQAGQQKELPDTKKAGTYGNQKPQDKESQLLELVEQHDAQASKALFKRQIQQHMPSYYGQKNW